MNIVISTKWFLPLLGGSIVYAQMLAEEFARQGHEVTLMTRTAGDDLVERNYNLVRQASWREIVALAKKADVVLQVDASWRDIIPFLLQGVPWFPTIHRGMPEISGFNFKSRLLLWAEWVAYRIGHSIGVSEYVSQGWKVGSRTIQNPFNSKFYFLPQEENKRDIDVLYVGRISRDKGVMVLLEALALVVNSNVLVQRVVYIGDVFRNDGILEELKMAAKELLPNVEIVFTGQLQPEAVGDWMRRSRILAFPTTPDWLEASGLTILEAAACGCHVVASRIGGTPENMPLGHTLVEAGNVQDLAQGLKQALLLHDSPVTEVTQHFLKNRSLEFTAKLYLDFFQSFIKINNHA